MGRSRRILILTIALLCVSTACLNWSESQVSTRQPDKVLFDRGMRAVEQNRFDVAYVTFQSLIATYPNSEFIPKIQQLLQDPRMPACNEFWHAFECSELVSIAPSRDQNG